MVIGTMTLKIRGAAPGGLTAKVWRLIVKNAYFSAADFWHRRLRSKHFAESAKTEYRYTPRSGARSTPGSKRNRRSYAGQKRRKFGHSRPLTLTGRSMALTAQRRISGSSKRARITMRAGALGRKHPSGRIDMADELTRMSPGDRQAIAEHVAEVIEELVKDVRVEREIKI